MFFAFVEKMNLNYYVSLDNYNRDKIYISKIFDWYKEDFIQASGSVIKFINQYSDLKLEAPQILYTQYSWELNN